MQPYQDTPDTIPDHARLIQRIHAKCCDWKTIDSDGNPRINTGAVQFSNPTASREAGYPGPSMSVIVEHLADPIDDLKRRYSKDGLAYLNAELVRAQGGLGIQLMPTDQEPAHAVVFRTDGRNRLSKGIRHIFAEHLSQNWIIPPPRLTYT